MNRFMFLIVIVLIYAGSHAQPWAGSTYPDEAGFQQRMQPMLERIANKGFGERSKAISKCPDTGLPVKAWAVEGEQIISPYTGRLYVQGETGYFGPKARNKKGDIIAFGGDPLKYDLPPATATLLLNSEDQIARAFLSIPGNMRQQYHFACKNWARFYPLLGHVMSPEWRSEFYGWVSRHTESRRPSDGERENAPLFVVHNLVGEPGQLLGGNPLNGGTENHKTMWRTSGLLYSQLLSDTSSVSGYPVKEAESLTKAMIRDYLKRLLVTGNGEYDSQIYYPHSIEGFLNLYDFSPDEETRELAKFALDYYFLTYGLKVVDGTIAGPQKRGYLATSEPGEMETMLWGFFNHTSRHMDESVVTIQQATTTYRPNRVIYNIVNKQIALPFEAHMSRPFYHMDRAYAFAETFYCSNHFAIGNIQMTIVDNPNQQMVWSLVAKGSQGPLCFSGGHPMRRSTSGHSPYTQTLQSGSSLIVMTAASIVGSDDETPFAPNYSKVERPNLWLLPQSEQGENFEVRNRRKYADHPLHFVDQPANFSASELERFWNESIGSASTWFIYPASLTPVFINGIWYLEAGNTLLALIPLTEKSYTVTPAINREMKLSRDVYNFFKDYHVIVFSGEISGFVLEAAEQRGSLDVFRQKVESQSQLKQSKGKIVYKTLRNDVAEMLYQPNGLRCKGIINGKEQKWDQHTKGAVYQSPYVRIKNGIMQVSDGNEGYEVDFRGGRPRYRPIKN